MASKVKETIAKVKNNPVGAVVGAGAGYLIASKVLKTTNIWMTVGIALVGGIAGALTQATIKARKGQPTAVTATPPKK